MENSLAGQTIAVTGATSGIGLAITHTLLREGASVIGISRSPKLCEETRHYLQSIYPQAGIDYLIADLSLQSQVRSTAAKVREILTAQGKNGLDALINNAGTYTQQLTLTAEGFETQWAVNYLAPFLLTLELLPSLQASPSARVITVSSDSHYWGRMNWQDLQMLHHYNGLRAYAQSKLAVVLFTGELNRQLGATSSVRALAADPGLVKTNIGFKGTPALVRWVWSWRRSGGTTAEKAAEDIVFLLREATVRKARDIYWRYGIPRLPSCPAMDPVAAQRLWKLSKQMCGVDWNNEYVIENRYCPAY